MKFELFDDSGIKVTHNGITEVVFVRGKYLRQEAEQWVKAANKVAEAFPKASLFSIKKIVKQNIVFDYS